MTEDFIRKHFDEVNDPESWKKISEYGSFSYSFMREFADYLDFNIMLSRRDFKLDFIREFEDKIDLRKLPVSLKVKILEEYADYFDDWQWDMLSQFGHLEKDFVKKHAEKLNWFSIITRQLGIDEKFRMNNMWRCEDWEQSQIKQMFDFAKRKGWKYW